MYKEVASHIPNVWIYPTISLLIFFSFFVILFFVVFTRRKELVTYQKMRPLDDGVTSEKAFDKFND